MSDSHHRGAVAAVVDLALRSAIQRHRRTTLRTDNDVAVIRVVPPDAKLDVDRVYIHEDWETSDVYGNS